MSQPYDLIELFDVEAALGGGWGGWYTRREEEVRAEVLAEVRDVAADASLLREQEDWNALKDRMVGAEGG
jgi:hypothetical protein